ncbi:MAG: DHA2 family efflux MFS transporter permease subunit, partial [Sinobacteraceae bacterium]|nr:DHA2 family efflux MFS transporter permease subunit [Nevskiaceae bacterium]
AGPVLGGLITDNYRWNWIFFINVPIGLVVAALVWLLLRDRESPIVREAMDYTGLALLAVGLFCLQVVLDKGNQDAWFQSPLIAGLAIVAALALALFLVWELTEEHPLVDLRIFSDRNFSIGCLTLVLGYMAYFSGVVLLPLWLQTALPYNYNATWAGYATSSIGICAFFASPIAGRLLDRHDPRLLMTVGVFIFAGVSFAVAFANTQIDFARVFLLRLPWGVGLTFFFTSLRMIAFSRIPRQNMAAAAGLYNFARLEALSIGTSFSIALWDHREALHDHHITSLVNPSNPALHGFLQRAAEAGLSLQQSWALLAHQIENQAFMIGLNDIYWLSGWLFLALLGLVWFSHPVRQRSKPKPAAR